MTVELRDAYGKPLRQLIDGAVDLSRVLPPIGDPDFPMPGLLDPYGDTIFSSLQMKAVIPELRRLKRLTPKPPCVLDELEEMAGECADGVHMFLAFIGD
ncbi:MAG: hypothetical protein JWR83_262 [Aeromicrobium sp.]|nr:hypothetical protein [Aeromicrobium sp.]